jgi:hypothetical protein
MSRIPPPVRVRFPFRRANRDDITAEPGTPAQAVASFIQARTAYATTVELSEDGDETVVRVSDIPSNTAHDIFNLMSERLPDAKGIVQNSSLELRVPKIQFEGFTPTS